MQVIAEIAMGHDGSLGTALAYVQACAYAGVDGVKLQCHTGDPRTKLRPGVWLPQDENCQAYLKRTSFNDHEWCQIAEACEKFGIDFIVSPFSMAAFEQMQRVGVDRWKIGSAQVTNHELIDACVGTGKPVILSSGMSTWEELHAAIERMQGVQLTILQCTSQYPCPPEKIGLQWARNHQDWFPGIGLSDHSGQIWPSIAAAVLGLEMVEVHVVFSRECFGPDVSSSITLDELKQLVRGVRFIESMGLDQEHDKEAMASELAGMREVFRGA